jgi:hypothetical protein
MVKGHRLDQAPRGKSKPPGKVEGRGLIRDATHLIQDSVVRKHGHESGGDLHDGLLPRSSKENAIRDSEQIFRS